MNKYLHYFGHCELWFELNGWVKGNKSNLCDCSDCVVCQIRRGVGVEEKQLTMYDVRYKSKKL
jgi:hypothetical protein